MKRWLRRILATVGHRRAEEELAREMASHLALLEDGYRRQGMSSEGARYAARRAMGGVEQAKEHHREARAFRWMDDLLRDLRFSLRSLRRTPGVTATIVVILGLGIGVNAGGPFGSISSRSADPACCRGGFSTTRWTLTSWPTSRWYRSGPGCSSGWYRLSGSRDSTSTPR